ncbi:MAG: hypothetical protein HXS41_06005 [Theionarchaea archaeon]|nr:hypothetical protein [Theionarchaea archaeon]MBU7020592.1 hypothetical protein [Theionarchaea archaeon]MBU7034241.1 hypothetical protein [Theionarchaea archaeon]MBU7039315.1 hypothetical protein [Theionarchaea archaeon]
MSSVCAIYSIQPGKVANTLIVEQVWSVATGTLPEGYTSIFPFAINSDSYMLMYDKTTHEADMYLIKGTTWMNRVASQDLDSGFDIMNSFLLANQPHILAYNAKSGTFEFFLIEQNLTLSLLYTYSKSYGDDATVGYTTVQPFSYRGSVYYLCYNFDTGGIAVYQLSVPETEPLKTTGIYLHEWAQGWTRFAFFKVGGENFFLKTNTKYVNVNIDHIVDDPSQGSHPVGTHLNLPQDLDTVAAFSMNGGDPYFVTYKKSGETTFNRIHGDCLGWTQEAALSTVEDASLAVPFQIGSMNYVLIY